MAVATTNFEYAVRDRGGNLVTGVLEAPTREAVVSRLKQMGLAPISVTEANAGLQREIKLPSLRAPVKLKELAVFSRQFATMVNSGLSLIRALTILWEQQPNQAFRKVLGEVRTDVESGVALSTALGKHPKIFPPLMVHMTRAGEVGGFLDRAMNQVADNYEAEVKLRGKVKSAMTYPVVVFVLAILMCLVMLLFIVPVFAKMFDSLGGTLPLPTRILVILSHALKTVFPLLVVFSVGFAFWWRKYSRAERVRGVVDPFKLWVPIFGPVFQKIALSRFARNLGTMIASGVPILHSLDIVADTTGNVVLARAIRAVQDSVRQGESISAPLQAHPVFPPMVVQMLAVGEDTGALDQMLHKIGDFYDAEVEAATESLTAMIEPLMIAFLGAVVGSMVVALYMPIFDIYNLVH